jgi:membrane protease YdiL (CAAX protease family)
MFKNIIYNAEKKVRNGWWILIFFLVLASILFPLIFLADRFSFEITMMHQALIILIASIICQFLRKDSLINLVGKINSSWFKELFIGIGIGAVLMALPALVLTFLGFINWHFNVLSVSTLLSGGALYISVALAEELFFRGFLFQRFIDGIGKWPAQLIIAGLFLLTHINNPGMTGVVKTFASINIFIASILFGLVYLKTKSLAMPIGLHFMANLTQGTILGFGVSGNTDPSLLLPNFTTSKLWLTGGSFGLEASAIGLLFLILTISIVYFKNPIKLKLIR